MTAKKIDSELTITLWPIKITARGSEAISAVRWPVAVILCALALLLLSRLPFYNFSENLDRIGHLIFGGG